MERVGRIVRMLAVEALRPRTSENAVKAKFAEPSSLVKKVPLGSKCLSRDVFGHHETREGRLRAVGELPPAPVSSEVCS